MADIQVPPPLLSTSAPSKSKTTSFSTPKSYSPRRLPRVWGTTRTLVLASVPPRKPSSPTTSIASAPSLPEWPSAVRSLKESSSRPRCKGLSSSAETTCTMCPSTTGTKNVTATSLPTSHPPFPSRKEISCWSESAGPSPRPSTSTSSRSPPTKLSATSASSSCSSDRISTETYLSSLYMPFPFPSPPAHY